MGAVLWIVCKRSQLMRELHAYMAGDCLQLSSKKCFFMWAGNSGQAGEGFNPAWRVSFDRSCRRSV